MPQTPQYGLRYPDGNAAPNGPDQIADLAVDTEAALLGNLPQNWPVAQLRQASGQTQLNIPAATWTSLNLPTEDFDTGNGHSTSTNTSRWTCPAGQGGIYLVSGVVVFVAEAAGTERNARIVKNDAVLPASTGVAFSAATSLGGHAVTTGPKLLSLIPGDYVLLQGWSSTIWGTAWFADAASHLVLMRIR